MSSNPYGMSDREYAESLEVVNRYKASAGAFVRQMVVAHAANDPAAGAELVSQLYGANDPMMLMMVLGHFTGVLAELQAKVGGPLATHQDLGIGDSVRQPWETAVVDQVEAAIAAGDPRAYGRIALDGQLRALKHDAAGGHGWDNIARSMLLLDQTSLVMMASEAVSRLLKEDG